MPLEPTAVLDALKVVRDPDLQRDIVSLGFIKDLRIDDGRVAFTIELTTPACPVKDQMRDQARAAVMQVAGVSGVDVTMSARVTPRGRAMRWCRIGRRNAAVLPLPVMAQASRSRPAMAGGIASI